MAEIRQDDRSGDRDRCPKCLAARAALTDAPAPQEGTTPMADKAKELCVGEQTLAEWLDREEWIKHCHARKATCPQCGHRWAAPACGPTHAAICAARRSMPSREAMK